MSQRASGPVTIVTMFLKAPPENSVDPGFDIDVKCKVEPFKHFPKAGEALSTTWVLQTWVPTLSLYTTNLPIATNIGRRCVATLPNSSIDAARTHRRNAHVHRRLSDPARTTQTRLQNTRILRVDMLLGSLTKQLCSTPRPEEQAG